MSSSTSPEQIASTLLATQGLHLRSLKVIQSLWAGYGFICYITASLSPSPDSSEQSSRTASTENSASSTPQETQSFILKLISPPPMKEHNEGHNRKLLSYRVEQYFYKHLATQLPPSLPVAKCLASIDERYPDGTSTTAMLLTDLRQRYPVAGGKREFLNRIQVSTALNWLSGFHGFWWSRIRQIDPATLVSPPNEEASHMQHSATNANRSIWLNGGYTYLATRWSEFKSLADDYDNEWKEPLTEWKSDTLSMAELLAKFLEPKRHGWNPVQEYMTVLHGDVKSENLFTSASGEEVAFYDFQYTGLGLGVCDLAKFFTCSVPLEMLVDSLPLPRQLEMQRGEMALLEQYRNRITAVSGNKYEWQVFVRHWETALVDWLRFQAGWGFWGNTEWLQARVRSILKDAKWRDAVTMTATSQIALDAI